MDKKPQTKSPSATNKPVQPSTNKPAQYPGSKSPSTPKKPGSSW